MKQPVAPDSAGIAISLRSTNTRGGGDLANASTAAHESAVSDIFPDHRSAVVLVTAIKAPAAMGVCAGDDGARFPAEVTTDDDDNGGGVKASS